MPLRRAELYYQSEALTWERAAFIRARPVAGDMKLGAEFLEHVQPFIWRRSLDYTAVREIEDMSLRIRDHFEGPREFGPGFDLKRGQGGIREIEFFTQAHQLIFGGRDPSVRLPGTRGALTALAKADRIGAEDAAQLAATYEQLRNAEHRLQMRHDEQTHSVPEQKADREAFARLCGERSFASFAARMRPKLTDASARYEALVERAEHPAVPRGKKLAAWLAEQKIPARRELEALIGKWRQGSYRALRSEAAQRELEAALPVLVEAFGSLSAPQNALRRFDDFLSRLPTAVRFFALISANPPLAGLLSRVMGHAPLLAGKLGRRPELFDILIAADLEALKPAAELESRLHSVVSRAQDLEGKLDAVRHWAGEQRFRVGVMLVEGKLDPLEAANGYSDIADAVVRVLLGAVCEGLSRKVTAGSQTVQRR